MTSSSSSPQDKQSLAQNYPEGLRADALMEEDVAWSHEIDGERDGDQFDRFDRAALRRVAGLSTELEDVTEVEYRQLRLERVVLVGVWTSGTAADAVGSGGIMPMADTAFFCTNSGSARSGLPRGSPSVKSMGSSTLPAAR